MAWRCGVAAVMVGVVWWGTGPGAMAELRAWSPPSGRQQVADGDLIRLDAAASVAADPDAVVAALAAMGPIEFDYSSTALTATSEARLTEAAALLGGHCCGAVITIVGHTDSSGTEADNQALSERRAAAVRTRLIDGGVDPSVIRVEGRGEREPLLWPEQHPADRAANRRIEWQTGLQTPG